MAIIIFIMQARDVGPGEPLLTSGGFISRSGCFFSQKKLYNLSMILEMKVGFAFLSFNISCPGISGHCDA